MTRRVRILHVITRLELGGAQRNTLYTVGHLDRRAFSPALAWGPGDALDAEARELADVSRFEIEALVRPVRPVTDFRAVAALRRAIHDFRPAIVHTHSSKAGILGRLAARLERVPAVVHSVHGWGFAPTQPWPVQRLFRTAERLAARWTDHFVTVSKSNLDLGVRLGIVDPRRASVIRSGIALAPLRSERDPAPIRAALGLPAGAPLIAQIGNFKPQKDPLTFVRVASMVAEHCPHARFVMVGDGPLRPAAEELAARLGVGEEMRFPGWWEDVPGLLATTRVSVLTSRHEGLPRAIVESLAAGVPVVATAVDGTPEVVRQGENGFLEKPGDCDGLAARIVDLIRDDALHKDFARRAPQGLDEFDIDAMVRRQEELYRCLVPIRTT